MQSPGLQDVLEEVAQRASGFSISVNGRVKRHLLYCRGGFSIVYQGTLDESPHDIQVAVKTIPISGDIRQLDNYTMAIKVEPSPLSIIYLRLFRRRTAKYTLGRSCLTRISSRCLESLQILIARFP